ncbi:hypothetical protein WJX72_011573 [[Myrmecia] bisecta]|uniref:Uncharacterized protein n=1 Tax=[Myrmecia] bisecta TaxID=41462 RepID=A0AAW1R9R3_9CHLO
MAAGPSRRSASPFASITADATDTDTDTDEARRDAKRNAAKLEKLRVAPEVWDTMTDAEKEKHWEKLLKATKVTYEGRRVTLKQLAEEVAEEEKPKVAEPTLRQTPRWKVKQDMPSSRLRPGAHKQILLPWETDALPLDQFGQGKQWPRNNRFGHLFGGKADFTWGIYGRADAAEKVMGPSWAGMNPEEVLTHPDYYNDILSRANQLELTLMAIMGRDLPVKPCLAMLEGRVRESMRLMASAKEDRSMPQKLAELSQEDETAVAQLRGAFGEPRLKDSGAYAKGALKEGSHVVFTAGPEGQLIAEVISPDRLKDRRTTLLASIHNPNLTLAVFEQFLGFAPLNTPGKVAVGQGILYAANGFKTTRLMHQKNRLLAQNDEDQYTLKAPEVEVLPPIKDIFSLQDDWLEPVARPLLGGIRRARRAAHQMRRAAAA